MHEFDKCNFCSSYSNGSCSDIFCHGHSDYILDVAKILRKAIVMNISVTDVLNLMREVNG